MKLIITDLDNTLLRNDKSISEYTANVFERLREKGHLIAFATARGCAMSRFVETIKPDIIVSNGGATILVNGKVIYRNMLSEKDVETIIAMCYEFTDGKALITAENDDGYYCNFVPSDLERRSIFTYSDFKDFRKPAYKVTATLEKDEWAEAIVKSCSNCSLLNFTGENWRRYAADNSNKETSLKILAKHLRIDFGDVVAFGDDINDLGMLKRSGTAVAVSNAIDEVKAVADHITESNDQDGVAKFLERTLLA